MAFSDLFLLAIRGVVSKFIRYRLGKQGQAAGPAIGPLFSVLQNNLGG
jgi:hypothetical protein